jgi:hypothetical protein
VRGLASPVALNRDLFPARRLVHAIVWHTKYHGEIIYRRF